MAKPKLRFLEFTDEWEEKQLKDFMVFKNGLNADKDKFGSGIKFISVMDILNNPFITYDIIRGKVDVDEKTLDNYSVTYGDVLFQRSSETREDAGKSNVYLDKENTATFGGFVIRGKKTGNYSPEFMNSLLKSQRVRKEITSKSQGAQHINVGQETLENVSVTLPTIKEQERIAELLSSIDDAIQLQEEETAALEEQKKGVMQKLFNREVRFKADDGSEYPEWEKKKLIDVCKYVDYRGKTPEKTDGGVFLVTAKNVRQGYIDYDISQEYVSEYKYDEIMHRGKPKIGDVIITTEAPCGFVAQIDREDIALAQRIIKYRGKEKIVYNAYLKYALLSEEFQKMLLQKSTGGTVKGIKGSVLHTLKIKLPCLVEQQKIADCLSAYDEVIQIKKDKLEVWKKIKKGLLQQMFV